MREENLTSSLDGICAACGSKESVRFVEELHLRKLYKVGECSKCSYEHHILVKKL